MSNRPPKSNTNDTEEVDEESVENTVKLQLRRLERAKKALNNFKKDGEDRKSLRRYYQSKLDAFSKIVSEFEDGDRLLVQLIPSSDQPTTPYFKDDITDQFESAQLDFVMLVQGEFDKRFPPEERPPPSSDVHHLKQPTSHTKLPPIDIGHFSGIPSEWKTFRDFFKSLIHKNENLPDSHKFHYLSSALQGEARDVISCYTVCDEDYAKAWKALNDTYNDKPSMFLYVMNKFSSMEPVTKENPERLRDIIKSTSACLKSLESVGLVAANVDEIITYYVIRKLPSDTIAYWEQTRDRTKLPTFDALKSCIETRIRVSAAVANHKSESSIVEAKSANINNIHQSKASYQQQQQTRKKNVKAYQATSKRVSSAPTSAATSLSTATATSNQQQRSYNCPLCIGEGHPLRMCDKFLAMAATERKGQITKLQYCVNCLAYNHTESKCRSSHTCYSCGERHHSLLHISSSTSEATKKVAAHISTSDQTLQVITCNAKTELSSHVLLATAIVSVRDVNGELHALRALIDQGSEANFITESAVQALQLPKSAAHIIINGIGSATSQSKHSTNITLQSQYSNAFTITIEAFVLAKVTNLIPSVNFKPQVWPHIADLTLADPSFHRSGRIDLILGAETFANIILEGVRIGTNGTPVAQQTQFGWILSGTVSNENNATTVVRVHHASPSIETLMENFLSVESIEDANPLSAEEQFCENQFNETHRRNEDGRFIVRLPFRSLCDASIALGRSRDIAIKCLLQLERRFARNPKLKEKYSTAINEYLENGRMQLTSSDEIERNGTVCSAYLPHHAVIKESSTSTKLRVVFDGSRKTTNGKSLNENLLAGPTIQSDIVTIIINWRFHRIAFIADAQKMYLQVMVDPRDIQFQRIVWRNEPSEPIQDFCLNRLTFGTTCAPFLAIRSINQLAEETKAMYPEASSIIKNDSYVDDVISGGDDVAEAKKSIVDLKTIMKSGGFDLRKWASNVSEVLEQIPADEREVKLPVELNENDPIKALGIAWNTATDSFQFSTSLTNEIQQQPVTKRYAASIIAKVFDPIGLIAPIIVVGKIVMKQLWAADVGWDDELPPHLLIELKNYVNSLQQLTEIKIPRWISTTKSSTSFQLHGFCDASTMAYGAAIYLRTVNQNSKVHVHLIASKSKVAPKKALTIPRLELCGAHLLSKLMNIVLGGFRHISVPAEDVVCWCDSEIVCHWLRNNKPKKVFVENRISKIHEATMGMKWRHIRTNENPADLVSRGVTPKELASNQLWWHGPSFLRTSEENWPVSTIDVSIPPADIDLELKRELQANVCVRDDDIMFRFSSYNRLIRVTSWCTRFIHNCKNTDNRIRGNLSVDEFQSTRRKYILQVQKHHYNDEIKCLSSNPPIPLSDKSKLISLLPFIDGNGILRVRGRLEYSTLSYNERHPIILPPDHHFTKLLIDRIHLRMMHAGTQAIISRLRKEYWIVHARNAIKYQILKCVNCFRQRAKTSQQLMGSLPPARVRRSVRPFLHTGVDYCGPIEIRASKYRGIKSYKAYIAVFICLTVKAVHIECVDGLTTEAFLAAFKRFVARRGLPSDMYSDNGTNFVGAANEMDREYQKLIHESESKTAEKFTEDNVRWHFTPPGSPHFGGLWEAGVKSVKHHLRHTIGETKLSYEEMLTLLTQIEAGLNSRPMFANSNDSSDLNAITPGHFLINTDLLSVPEPSIIDVNTNRLSRWQLIQQLRQIWWKRWRDDYLSQLQQRPKWYKKFPNLKVNELVLVRDDRYPSFKWPLARIVEIHPGSDGCVRVVTVRTASGIYKRNITKICRLPIEYDEPMDININEARASETNENQNIEHQPTCAQNDTEKE